LRAQNAPYDARMNRCTGLVSALVATSTIACASIAPDGVAPDGGSDPTADAAPSTDAPPGGKPDARPIPPGDAGGTDPAMVAACTAQIEYVNTSARDGALFEQKVPDVSAFFHAKSLQVCLVLYRTAAEVPRRPRLKFVLEDDEGVAYTVCGDNNCDEMHLNAGYLADYAASNDDLEDEIHGVIVHELAHVYQHMDGPGGLIEGMADYVRHRAGYVPLSRRQPGGNWDDPYNTSAFFVAWLDDKYPGLGYQLNQRMRADDRTAWSEQVFVDLTGKDVDTLWREYQAAI